MNSNIYSVTDARNNFGYLLDKLENGTEQEILIARRGVCIAKLIPQKKKKAKASDMIGAAKGDLFVNDKVFDELDEEIADLISGGNI